MNKEALVDIVGWIGAIALLVAYALVSARRVKGDSTSYQSLNLVGSVLLIVNTVYYRAYPSAFLTGISVLPAPDGTFIHPIAADRTKTSIVAQSLSFKGLHLSPRRRATDWNPCFSGISQTPLHTCAPCHRRAGFVALQAARQPAGTGSAQILRSMSPNSRRVRCPSASRSQ